VRAATKPAKHAGAYCRRCDAARALRYHYEHAERISTRKAAKREEAARERWEAYLEEKRRPATPWRELIGREG
jgi:hypothetical protein